MIDVIACRVNDGSGRSEGGKFDAMYLPDSIKKEMCLSLLAEFGVGKIQTREPDGELIHCCVMPWHPEKKPSASLNYKKLTYKCLGCDASGGFLWLIGTVRHSSGREAREWVETRTGLGGSDFDLPAMLALIDAVLNEEISGPPPIPKFAERVLDQWRGIHPTLTTGAPDLGIMGRGIREENLREMRVGYAPEYPMGEGQPTSERHIIPHFWRGSLVGWQSRRVWDDGTEKYKSTPDFPKYRTIYAADRHRPTKSRSLVCVESPMSVLRHLHHLPMGGTFGAAITDPQIRLLADYDRIIYWPDNDVAGWKSVQGWTDDKGEYHPGIERLERYSEVWVTQSPWAADPGDIDDDEEAERIVAEAVPYAVWTPPSTLLCWACKREHSGVCP